jgi:nucleoid-associated protein YgaU
VVQPNDSFWVISKRVFGSGAYYQAIHEHNRERFPNQDSLQVGDVLEIPPAEYLQKTYPDLCPKPRKGAPLPPASSATPPPGSRVYLVEEGDTLFDIARHELGSPKRWVEIYDLNRQVLSEDLHYLKPGLELILPPRHSGRETPAQRTTTRSPRS